MSDKDENEMRAKECPFGDESLKAAIDVFLADLGWSRIYCEAPPGAKRRLEVAFWFSANKPTDDADAAERLEAYRNWRTDVEEGMTEEDLGYMITAIDKPAAKEHYAALLQSRRTGSHGSASGVKLMSYSDFFAMLDEQGEFKSFDYDDETKAEIVGDFLLVLEGSGDPLETHIEDILATAELKEVRVYPKDEVMYVRVMVRFLSEMAEWSRPYQMLAAWDCFNDLKGYTFPVGKGSRDELPIELENPENVAQREKRMQLRASRIAAAESGGRGRVRQ